MIAFLLLGCVAPPLPDGSEVDEAWAVRASEVEAPLAIPCLDRVGGVGPYTVAIDDRTGWTLLVEPEGRVWLREPFGAVPDQCWWLPPPGGSVDLTGQPCAPDGHQTGTCGPEAAIAGASFLAPGLAETGPLRTAVAVDGVMLAIGDGLERLDLTPDSDPPVDPSEALRTWLGWLPPIETEADAIAVGTALVLWDSDRGRIEVHGRGEGRRTLEERLNKRSAPSGEGVLTAAGDFAAVVTSGRAVVYEGLTDGPKRDRRRHPSLRDGVSAAVIDPDDGTVYALVPDGVVGLGPEDALSWHPTPGAQGLFLGRPAGVPTVYAWGNDADGNGVLWRLDADGVSSAARLDEQLLGAGTGEVFQEIVLVTREGDGVPHATGWLDQRHLDAIPAGAVGLAIAAFAESPRDPDLRDVALARAQIAMSGGRCDGDAPPGLEDAYALCCAQQLRGAALERQLDWLDDRLDPAWPGGPAAVVLGVNPTSIAASRLCEAVDDPGIAAMGPALPTAAGAWLLDAGPRGVGAGAVFLHSSPFEPDSSWVACPEAWPYEADASCWDTARTPDTQRAFLDDLSAAASLAGWVGEEPDWRRIAGGFGETPLPDAGWPDLFGDLALPDGSPAEDGLYFGNLGMDPRTPLALTKELAPATASIRPFPVAVGTPSDRWDDGGVPTGATYWPGQTFSLPYVWESRRSGLLLDDWIVLAGAGTDWQEEAFRGAEGPDTMNHADFALEEHYLVTRVLAHRDVSAGRWWYFHLSDLTRLRSNGLEDGWIDCIGDCATDTELDRFLLRLQAWQPAVQWKPRPDVAP